MRSLYQKPHKNNIILVHLRSRQDTTVGSTFGTILGYLFQLFIGCVPLDPAAGYRALLLFESDISFIRLKHYFLRLRRLLSPWLRPLCVGLPYCAPAMECHRDFVAFVLRFFF